MLVILTYCLMVVKANYYILKKGLLMLCSQALHVNKYIIIFIISIISAQELNVEA